MQYHWCCFFDSLLAKDCQYPRDPMQPVIKKKNLFVTMSRLKKNLIVNLSQTTQWLLHHDHLLPSGRWRGTGSVSGEPEGKVVAIVCLVSPSLGGRFLFLLSVPLFVCRRGCVLRRGVPLSRHFEWCCMK